MRVLLLGGTTEASALARTLAQARVNAVFSYAGRTNAPGAQPLPTRVGGFGGVAGLTKYIEAEAITHVVDATHPFAAQMSSNAVDACASNQTALLRFERPAWAAAPEDSWQSFKSIEDIPAALPAKPARVFLAIGKQHIALFATRPKHHYVLRLVDAPDAALPLPNASVLVARGPFDVAGDRALMERECISHIVAKNSGGRGAQAKLEAARALGLPVLMAQRPDLPWANTASTVADVMQWLHHPADLGV